MSRNDLEWQREYQREWYKKHQPRIRAKRKAQFNENRERYQALKMQPCVDCGFVPQVPEQMDFDHLDEKNKNISQMLKYNEWDRLLEEVKLCDLVCANCHRLRTHIRRNASVA